MALQTAKHEQIKARQELAAAELLLARSKARKNFVDYCEYMWAEEPPAAHHKLLCNALDDVIEGRLKRLMVFYPPGAAKSTYSSVRFPSYYLGRFPEKSIICASYGEGLATTFGRKVRNIVKSREYGVLFDTRLAEDSQSKGEWATHLDGSYFAAGVGSGITGRRADFGLIDDPIKGMKDANSKLVRDEAWNWYKSDFFSRLKPGAAQCIIQTRWHDDDLSGRILPDDWNGESGDFEGFDGQIWKVICLPAQAREGDVLGRKVDEWLWTDYFKVSHWEEIKSVQTNKGTQFRVWNCLYQQVPQPDTGVFFKREWFEGNRYELGNYPNLSIYGASDYAVSDGKGDSTEHGIGGFDIDDDLYLVDWWHGKVTPDVWITEQIRLADSWKPYAWLAEVGVIRRSVEPFLKKAKRKARCYFRQEWMNHIGDKGANARAFQSLAASGKVYIPKCEWGDRIVDQLVKFVPNTNYEDDAVDVCGLLGRILESSFAPTDVVNTEKVIVDEYGFDDEEQSSWKTG